MGIFLQIVVGSFLGYIVGVFLIFWRDWSRDRFWVDSEGKSPRDRRREKS